MKPWKSLKKFYEDYPKPENLPDPIAAALMQFFFSGFLLGGLIMMFIFLLWT